MRSDSRLFFLGGVVYIQLISMGKSIVLHGNQLTTDERFRVDTGLP